MTKCFNFENTGHKFRPLDGVNGIVCRLYCARCGRITMATLENNVAYWDYNLLDAAAQNDFMASNSLIIRKSDA